MQWSIRDPIFLNLDQLLAALHHLVNIEGWNTELKMRAIHPMEVLVSSKQDDLIIDCSVSFGTFETLDSILHTSI